jgi:WD40 repeat protein
VPLNIYIGKGCVKNDIILFGVNQSFLNIWKMKTNIAILFLCILGLTIPGYAQVNPTILSGHQNDVEALAFSSEGFVASGSYDQMINVYKADSPFVFVKSLKGHLGPVNVLAFNRKGKVLASGSEDRAVILWDSTWKLMRKLEGHKDKVTSLMFDPMGRYVYSGSDDKTIIIWEVVTGKTIKTLTHSTRINAMASTSDIKTLYVAGAEPKIKIYDVIKGTVLKTLDGHTDAVNDIAISRNGKYLLSGSNDKTARLFNLTTGKQIRVLPVDCWKVTSVCFSSDDQYALTGCNDGTIKVWEVETGKLIKTITAESATTRDVAFNQNSTIVFGAFLLREGTNYGIQVFNSGILPKVSINPTNAVQPKINMVKDSIDKTNKPLNGVKKVTPSNNTQTTPTDTLLIKRPKSQGIKPGTTAPASGRN